MFVVHLTLTMYNHQTWEIMATLGGKMMNVCELTHPFSDATLAKNNSAPNKETQWPLE